MKFLLPLFILSFLTNILGAQISGITTREQNQKWLEELKILPVKEQVKKINERLKNKASEFEKANTPKSTPDSNEYREVHPLFVVDGIPIDIDDLKELAKLTNKLSKEKVSITIVDEKTQSGALFCRPSSGVILIQTLNKGKEEKTKE
jgi:hypothetical protein